MSESEPLLELDDVTIQYRTSGGVLTAVSDASFSIGQGEYFGLGGESGCGKSRIAKTLISAIDDQRLAANASATGSRATSKAGEN